MKVVHLVNSVTPTSNSVTIAEKIDSHTPASVRLASFYDPQDQADNSKRETSLQLFNLNATNRFDLRAYKKLRQIIADEVDILHTHHNSVGSFARLASLGTGTSIVNTEHRSHDAFTPLQLATNVVSYPAIDAMVANSEHTLSSLRWFEHTLLRNKSVIKTIHNGIDTGRVKNSQCKPPVLPDGPLITNVSRMIEIKNQHRLISAFESISDKYGEATLVIVGDGPLRSELTELVRSLEITDRVYFTGQITRETVYAILRNSSIFTIPSLSEGFCVAAVEAMAAGLPVIASDISTLREVIGDCGLFVDPKSTTALADAIGRLLSNTELRSTLASAAADRADTEFPVSKTASEYYNIYTELI